MTMLHTSLDLIIVNKPCDRVQHVRTWLGDRSADELFPITDLLTVPGLIVPDDILWALSAVPEPEREECERIARLFACDCAERALLREREKGREPAPASWAAIEVARRFAAGEAPLDELVAARDAARDAARAAARDAAWDATWDAAWDAAWDAESKWQAQRLSAAVAGGRGR